MFLVVIFGVYILRLKCFLGMSTRVLCFCVNILCSWWLFLVFFCVLNVFLGKSTGVLFCVVVLILCVFGCYFWCLSFVSNVFLDMSTGDCIYDLGNYL